MAGNKKGSSLERVHMSGLFGRFNYQVSLKEGGITVRTVTGKRPS